MTVKDWLEYAASQLSGAGIGTARLDCLVLLEDATGKDRAWLLAHPEFVLENTALKKLNTLISRRVKHEPLAYIRGKTEFYSREFLLSKDVLEPRPESETMIDLLKELAANLQKSSLLKDSPLTDGGNASFRIVDVGTGSGAIGITAALEIPEVDVILTDIDPACLKMARQNARKYSVNVTFLQGDLLEPLPANSYPLTAILANLPYVPDHYQINEAALMEPRIAIFGGPDGLDLYRRLFRQVSDMPRKPAYILTESLPFQHQELAAVAKSANYKLLQSEDFIQVFYC